MECSLQDPILIFFRIWFSTICKLSDFLMHLWMFFSLFFWSLIISPDSLLSLSVHLVSISLWLRPQVIGCLQLSWTEATNSWAAPHHHAPTGIYPANTSSWANWPLTVCLAALKNHQSVSDRLFSNSVSSVQLIVNTSPRVSKYHVHVRGQFKTLPCSERQPSKVMFEEKIRSLSCLWW